MDFLSKLLQGIAFVPAVVNGIEGLLETVPARKRKTRPCLLFQPRCKSVTLSLRVTLLTKINSNLD